MDIFSYVYLLILYTWLHLSLKLIDSFDYSESMFPKHHIIHNHDFHMTYSDKLTKLGYGGFSSESLFLFY